MVSIEQKLAELRVKLAKSANQELLKDFDSVVHEVERLRRQSDESKKKANWYRIAILLDNIQDFFD